MGQTQTEDSGGNSFDGRIWVRDIDREWVNNHKQGGETQADVLERLIAFYEEHDPDAPDADSIDVDAIADAVAERAADKISRPEVTVDPDAVAAALAERIDLTGGGMNADDVRAAAERGVESALQGAR